MIVTCPHGVKVEIEGTPSFFSGFELRLTIREVLLGCPACRADADSRLEDVGRP